MSSTHPDGSIAKERRTSLGLYVTAKQAYDLWQSDPEGVRSLDCRTPEEYVFVGHPPMAADGGQHPFAFQSSDWDAARRAFHWELNPEFTAAVRRWASPGDTVLVGCRSGGRAAMANDRLVGLTSRTPTTSSTGWKVTRSRTPTVSRARPSSPVILPA